MAEAQAPTATSRWADEPVVVATTTVENRTKSKPIQRRHPKKQPQYVYLQKPHPVVPTTRVAEPRLSATDALLRRLDVVVAKEHRAGQLITDVCQHLVPFYYDNVVWAEQLLRQVVDELPDTVDPTVPTSAQLVNTRQELERRLLVVLHRGKKRRLEWAEFVRSTHATLAKQVIPCLINLIKAFGSDNPEQYHKCAAVALDVFNATRWHVLIQCHTTPHCYSELQSNAHLYLILTLVETLYALATYPYDKLEERTLTKFLDVLHQKHFLPISQFLKRPAAESGLDDTPVLHEDQVSVLLTTLSKLAACALFITKEAQPATVQRRLLVAHSTVWTLCVRRECRDATVCNAQRPLNLHLEALAPNVLNSLFQYRTIYACTNATVLQLCLQFLHQLEPEEEEKQQQQPWHQFQILAVRRHVAPGQRQAWWADLPQALQLFLAIRVSNTATRQIEFRLSSSSKTQSEETSAQVQQRLQQVLLQFAGHKKA